MAPAKKQESNLQEGNVKEEIVLTGNRLEYCLLAFNLSSCNPIRISHDGNKYLVLPLFDHKGGLHLLNIGETQLAECFIKKYLSKASVEISQCCISSP
jgi:hypothetical protein